MRHESPVAWDPTDKSLFRVPPEMQRDSVEFHRISAMCASGSYLCGAEDCEDRRLEVRATTSRKVNGGVRVMVAAHFRHRFAARHGAASDRVSAGESLHHVAAKEHLWRLGRGFGHESEVEVTAKGGDVARRPDVVWRPTDGSRPWAIEVQFSPLPTWQWRERTADLTKLGYRPLWFWGVCDQQGRGLELVDIDHHADRYRRPSDIWVIDVRSAGGELLAAVSQCHSVDFYWEVAAVSGGRRPHWPNVAEYDRNLSVEASAEFGVLCPELSRLLDEIEKAPGPAAARLRTHAVATVDEVDRRLLTSPSVIARYQETRHEESGPVLSGRNEICQGCGDPLFVCPSTLRHFIRCCARCTHLTQVDLDYFAANGIRQGAAPEAVGRGGGE